MKVSIVTVCWNSEQYIADAIKSVLNQSYQDIEYILVDGLSKDRTVDIIKSFEPQFNGRMKWVSEKDNGLYDAMNKGLKMASGDVFGILNSDDFFANPDVIQNIVDGFSSDSSIEAVYTNLYYVKQDQPEIIVRHWISNEFKPRSFFKGWHPPHPTLYMKKDTYEKCGYFDLSFRLAADFELMLRFFEKYKIKSKYLNITSIRMRLGGATSKNLSNIMTGNAECIQAFKVNGLNASILYPVYRLVPKLKQFINKR